ncbi:hypothetical protein P3H80_11710 [Mycolicibacterium septicum]|nr:hypothetical protein [Mycolicibacterium septicum]MDF3338093.1 hypothetical protein [Mycolicibacterium septicum]
MVDASTGETLGGQRYSRLLPKFGAYGNVPGITEGTPTIEVV